MRSRAFFKTLVSALTAALVLTLPLSSAGCGESGDTTLNFNTALSATQAETVKSIATDIGLTAVLYDGQGTPMRIAQSIDLNRYCDQNAVYLTAKMLTSEYNLSDALRLVVNGVAQQSPDIGGYITGKNALFLEAAIKSDTVNVRGDLSKKAETPDYKFVFDEAEKNIFFGVSLTDIYAFIADMDRDYMDDTDIVKSASQPLSLPVDWTAVTTGGPATFNMGSGSYNFRFTVPASMIWDLIIGQIDTMMAESLEKGDMTEDSPAYKAYHDHLDTIKSWFTISDVTVSASANADGLLTGMTTDLSVSLSVTDTAITELALAIGIIEDASELTQAFSLLHGFISAENGVSGRFDAKMLLSVSETYTYGSAVDTSGVIFTGLSDELAERTVLKYEKEQESEEYEWVAYGGDFEADINDRENPENEEDPEEDSGGTDVN